MKTCQICKRQSEKVEKRTLAAKIMGSIPVTSHKEMCDECCEKSRILFDNMKQDEPIGTNGESSEQARDTQGEGGPKESQQPESAG